MTVENRALLDPKCWIYKKIVLKLRQLYSSYTEGEKIENIFAAIMWYLQHLDGPRKRYGLKMSLVALMS